MKMQRCDNGAECSREVLQTWESNTGILLVKIQYRLGRHHRRAEVGLGGPILLLGSVKNGGGYGSSVSALRVREHYT